MKFIKIAVYAMLAGGVVHYTAAVIRDRTRPEVRQLAAPAPRPAMYAAPVADRMDHREGWDQ